MTPEQLKASILQYAIQGKLVEQRPEEGTGEELYRQIQAEKQRLIQEKKIKKEKPLAEISEDEIPFDIPESWKWVRWGNLSFSIQYGYNAPAKKSGRIKMVRISDIQEGKVVWDTVPFCDIKEEEIPTYLLSINDILFARTGGTVGKSYIVKEIPEEAIYAGYLIRTRYSDMLCPEYLYYFMQTHLYWTQLRNGTIATAQPNCNGQTLSKMILPLPPLAEQKRIVAKIEELLPLVDRYAVAYEKLEQVNAKFPDDMKKSILQYAIQGKLVEQRAEEGTGEELYQQIQAEKQRLIAEKKIKKEKPLPEIAENEKPYDIPDNWTWVRFGDLGSYKKGPFGSAITKSMFVPKGNGAIKVYEQKNAIQKDATLGDYYIRRDYFESKMKGFEVFPGDIIVSCAGTIGETYVMPDKFEQGIINQALMRMKIFEPLYIPYFLTFFDFVLKKNARSGSKGSAIKNIPPFEILKNYLVPIPPLAEQRRIVAKLEEILPLCERLK
jgi:type I restriction enzyme, S subunit